jgi:hypothetical protein
MEPIEFEVTLTDEVFVSRAGLPLAGQLLSRTQLHERLDGLKVAGAANPTIGHGDVAMSMTGLLCLGRPDYAAIEAEQPMALLPLSLGLGGLPSEQTLRQRLDHMGASCLNEVMTIVQDESAALVGAWAGGVDGVPGARPGRGVATLGGVGHRRGAVRQRQHDQARGEPHVQRGGRRRADLRVPR